MPALICGSLAFDTITTFEGRFAEQILPEQVHILNVSFLVPTLRREFGGCAGNIAYTLSQLGGEPLVLAALGRDGDQYMQRLSGWGVSTDHVRVDEDQFTAQAIIITDINNNQITAFHPGAMQSAQLTVVPARSDIHIAIIAPDGRDAMIEHAQQLAAACPCLTAPNSSASWHRPPGSHSMTTRLACCATAPGKPWSRCRARIWQASS